MNALDIKSNVKTNSFHKSQSFSLRLFRMAAEMIFLRVAFKSRYCDYFVAKLTVIITNDNRS